MPKPSKALKTGQVATAAVAQEGVHAHQRCVKIRRVHRGVNEADEEHRHLPK